jgi:glycerol-3-phosphate dehydrogenase (NAD(P)+)
MALNGHRVRQWVREADVVESMRERRKNPTYLPDVVIPDGVEPTERLECAVSGVDLVVSAVPSQFARAVYRELAAHVAAEVPLLLVTKGIERETLALPFEVAGEELGTERPIAVLSGPSFAAEVARGLPTVVVVASTNATLALQVQQTLSSDSLRLYTNPDPVGVQLAGALKNVIAIATGVAHSLTMGANVQAALITRGLAEMTRLGVCLGGRAMTFAGLAGMGDLVLTCTGDQSRNRQVGLRLGRGESLDAILRASNAVAEGVETTSSAHRLGRREGVELPIVDEVHRILFEDGSPRDSLTRLMGRPLTSEEDHARA